jgi:hypothetical protein
MNRREIFKGAAPCAPASYGLTAVEEDKKIIA